ncbi:MAG: AMP-binding protein, partial [Clostridia bacterium]|nr:AMP-binding protein [Clostridia bacterium]
MKLSVSTYGWSNFSFEDYASLAKEMHIEGVEIHDITESRFSGVGAPFQKGEIEHTVRGLTAQGLSITCLDARSNPADKNQAEKSGKEILFLIDMAKKVNASFVRIRALETGLSEAEEDENVKSVVRSVLNEAEKANVTILIETAGIYADTSRLADILNDFACDSLQALWDVHHPYRFRGEKPEKTITNLGAYVKHVHLKDSVVGACGPQYCLLGEGTLPMREIFLALRSVSYDGFYCLEWDPDWMKEISDPSVILAHFSSFVHGFEPESSWKSHLYMNKQGNGKYVWKHDQLIDATFPQVLDRMVQEFPDQLCFKYTTLDYTRTYSQFRDDVDACARALISLGVKPNSHVTIWATNVPAWYISFWATTKIGATLVTMNTAYKIAEAEYLLRQSDTHTLIMVDGYRDSNYVEIIKTLCPELKDTKPGESLHAKKLPFLRNVVTVGFSMDGCLTWDEMMARAPMVPVEEVYRRAAEIKGDDVANMQYTSGTTGFPKGVMLTHR